MTGNAPAEIEAWAPDLVLCLAPAIPKLWSAPSLQVLGGKEDQAFFTEAGLVALLSHDGWLVEDARVECLLRNVLHATRKHAPYIAPWYDTFVPAPLAEGTVVALPDRPVDLLHAVAADRPVVIGAGHPYAQAFHPHLPVITTDVPEAVIAAQLAALAAKQGGVGRPGPACRKIYDATFAPAAQIAHLHDAVDHIRRNRGYRPPASTTAPPDWRVAYILRAGGRPLSFLHRSLGSLARQTAAARIHAVLVLWREIEGLEELLEEYPHLAVTIVRQPGGDASACLSAGLAEVARLKPDHFGMIDDDDELMPHHLFLFRAALDRAERSTVPRPGLFHSAALRSSPAGFASPPALPVAGLAQPEKLRLSGLEFSHPALVAALRHTIHPLNWLADAALIDEEMLVDPRLAIVEDAYLFKSLCERATPRLVCEVTSFVHDHAHGQSNYHISPETVAAGERMALRFLGRSFPAGIAFGEGSSPASPTLHAPLPRRMTRPAGRPVFHELSFSSGHEIVTAPFPTAGGVIALSCTLRADPSDPAQWRAEARFTGQARAIPATNARLRCVNEELWEFSADFPLPDTRPFGGAATFHITLPAPAEALAVAARSTGQGTLVAWADIPRDRPLWIYGASELGQRIAARLGAAGHPGSTGFLDGFKSGRFAGLPIQPPSSLDPNGDPLILIAAQSWQHIATELRGMGWSGLYSGYPELNDGVIYLG